MKGLGLIVLLISLAIVGVLYKKQTEAQVVTPTGKAVHVDKLPDEVKVQVEAASKQAEKRIQDADSE